MPRLNLLEEDCLETAQRRTRVPVVEACLEMLGHSSRVRVVVEGCLGIARLVSRVRTVGCLVRVPRSSNSSPSSREVDYLERLLRIRTLSSNRAEDFSVLVRRRLRILSNRSRVLASLERH